MEGGTAQHSSAGMTSLSGVHEISEGMEESGVHNASGRDRVCVLVH